jgi:hypothetical protein
MLAGMIAVIRIRQNDKSTCLGVLLGTIRVTLFESGGVLTQTLFWGALVTPLEIASLS